MQFNYDSLTGDQFRIALAKLNIKPGEVTGALSDAAKTAVDEAVKEVLSRFGISGMEAVTGRGGVTAAPRKSSSAKPPAAPPQRRAKAHSSKRGRSTLTADQLKSRQLQGEYLGAIRRVPAKFRSRYQKVAQDKVNGGRGEAIRQINRDYPKE